MNVDPVKQQQLVNFLSRHELLGVRRVSTHNLYTWNPLLLGLDAAQINREQLAEQLLGMAEFRALQLGNWLGTTDGQLIVRAVELATPPIYRADVEVLVEGLKLAASIQQSRGRVVAGALVLGLIVGTAFLAFGSAPPSR